MKPSSAVRQNDSVIYFKKHTDVTMIVGFFFAHTCKCKQNTLTVLNLFHYWSEQATMAMMIHNAMCARHRYIGHTIQTKNVRWVEIVGQIHNLECLSKMYFLNKSVITQSCLSDTSFFFFERGIDTCNLIIIFNM